MQRQLHWISRVIRIPVLLNSLTRHLPGRASLWLTTERWSEEALFSLHGSHNGEVQIPADQLKTAAADTTTWQDQQGQSRQFHD